MLCRLFFTACHDWLTGEIDDCSLDDGVVARAPERDRTKHEGTGLDDGRGRELKRPSRFRLGLVIYRRWPIGTRGTTTATAMPTSASSDIECRKRYSSTMHDTGH